MSKILLTSLGLVSLMSILMSCEKDDSLKGSADSYLEKSGDIKTRAQEEKCYAKAVIYHGYIKCTDPGDNCEVKCTEGEATPSNVVAFFNSLDETIDNTVSIKNFMSSLNHVSQQIQQDIQSATRLDYLITNQGGSNSYAVLNEQGDVLYAFSY